MVRRRPIAIVAAARVVFARRIVADQQQTIEKLKVLGQPTLDAQNALQTYVSLLEHL